MPILSNVLLSTDGPKTLGLAATDLYLSVRSSCPAEVIKGGNVAVSARTLFEIVKNLPEGDLTLSTEDGHSVEIRSGKVRFKILGMPGEDFPALPSPGESKFSTIGLEFLGELISLTHYSMSMDETRPHLSGAMFEGDGRVVRMITTDGHRLSKAECKLNEGSDLLNFSMLVPAKGVSELRRLIEDVKSERSKGDKEPMNLGVTTTGGNAFFRYGDVLLSVKLTEEHFPPYDKVIPQSESRRLVMARSLLMDALKRISLVAKDRSGVVRFCISPGTLSITSENPDVGEGAEEIDIDYSGESLEIGFNARYLLDALSSLAEDEIELKLSGELDPGVVRPVGPTDFIGVIMPMRI